MKEDTQCVLVLTAGVIALLVSATLGIRMLIYFL